MRNGRISRAIKRIAAVMLALSVLMSLPLQASASADQAEINVLIYMIASDLESHDAAATENIENMLAAAENFGKEINLLVYAGGAKKWHNSIFSSEENRCVKISRNGAELLYAEETRNMADPETLSDFIRYCAENYPAGRNVLVMWNHGGGIAGFGADELNNYDKPMTILEIMDALKAGGLYFDILGFDACMMASFELAYSICENGRYMVASEEMIPIGGWDYSAWLSVLAENPKISSVDLCKTIVDTYMNWCKANAPGIKDALSVVDLKKINENSSQAIRNFSGEMVDSLLNGEYDVVSVQKAAIRHLGQANRINMIDAIEFAESVGGKAGKQLAAMLRESIIYNRNYPEQLNMNGLLIYIPIDDTFSGISLDDTDQIRAAGVDDTYIQWVTCIRKFMTFARSEQKHERTLMDVFEGAVTNDYDAAIADTVNETRLDVTGCYITEDEYLVPHLIMPEEKKRLITYVCQGLYEYDGGEIVDYGGFLFDAEAFPIQYSGFWKRMCDDWLYINGKMCPFYMEEKTKLSGERIVVYGYTKMCCNNDPGALFLRVIYDDSDESIVVEPLCFQEINFMNPNMQFGRIRPVAGIDPDSVVYFSCSRYSEESGSLWESQLTEEMRWGDITDFEWKYTPEIDELLTSYAVTDLYGSLHVLELK